MFARKPSTHPHYTTRTMQANSRIPGIAPGTLFTVCRNAVSLGVGGALAADGGESLNRALFSEEVRQNYPLGCVASGVHASVVMVLSFISSRGKFLSGCG